MSSAQLKVASAGRPLSAGAIALMLLLCLSWGFNQIAIKLVIPEIPPFTQAAIRSAGALLVILSIAWIRGVKLFARDGTLGAGLFAGVALAIGVPQADVDTQVLLGDLMVVGGGALWAATTLVAKATRLIKAPAEKVLGYQVAMSIPILAFSAWISGETIARVPGLLAISLMAYQAIWVVGMTFMLWFSLVKVYSASKLSAFSFITPLFGVVGGYFIMHDTLTPAFAAAAVLVIAGLYLVNRPNPPVIDPLLNVTKT